MITDNKRNESLLYGPSWNVIICTVTIWSQAQKSHKCRKSKTESAVVGTAKEEAFVESPETMISLGISGKIRYFSKKEVFKF